MVEWEKQEGGGELGEGQKTVKREAMIENVDLT